MITCRKVILNRHFQKLEYVNLGGDPCRRIWCKNRRTKRSGPCETLPFFPAFDGTTCGLNRVISKAIS